MNRRKFWLGIFLFMACGPLYGQMNITASQTANALVQSLVGTGVTYSNATLNCPGVSNGLFVVTPPNVTNLGIDSGIILTSGQAQTTSTQQGANVNNTLFTYTNGPALSNNTTGDADLTLLCNKTTNDACILEFDFIPLGDTVRFNYVFASSEYPSFTCTVYNDVFGFFISGPGITGPYSNNAKNIALVPGSTTCPVGVSTIYCPNSSGCCNTTQYCFGNTPGCGAFNATNNTCAYFVCNGSASTNTVAYEGFTTVLQAESEVVPCSTYHMKLAIADAQDWTLDSGVFLEEGSLTSNIVNFTPVSALSNPVPYMVEGCAPGAVRITRKKPLPTPLVVNYGLGGTAINGTDYANLSGTITIPANDTVAILTILPTLDALLEGTETVVIYKYATCGSTIVDSVTLEIHDDFDIDILNNDTTICSGDSVFIALAGSDSLNYTWTPATNINNPNIKEPIVFPTSTTAYIVSANQNAFAGCPPTKDTLLVTIQQQANVIGGSDTIICKGQSIQFNGTVNPNNQVYAYNWTGTGTPFLSATNIPDPLGTFTQTGIFTLILNASPSAIGCDGADTFTVEVLPDAIDILNNDTIVCDGATINFDVLGHNYFNYSWVPPTYLNNPGIEDPVGIIDSTIRYVVTATFTGCPPMKDSIYIEVQPTPVIEIGPPREICDYDTVQFYPDIDPDSYPSYSYAWTPAADMNNSTIRDAVFQGHNSVPVQLIVSTPIGCSDTDLTFITVNSTEFADVTPFESYLCPRDSIQYNITGAGISFLWRPGAYLSDSTIANPVAHPIAPLDYTVYSTSIKGCVDTDFVRVFINSGAVVDIGNDVTLYPGETYTMHPQGNVTKFFWTPPYALSATDIQNPLASPSATTRYYLYAETEDGCKVVDSILIRVSDESLLQLPNAFSPGSGSSINDNLHLIVRGIVNLNSFKLFNRWGELIFETTDINEGWDGKYKGKPQPLGTYIYLIDATSSTGKRFQKQGTITLLR